MSDAVLPALGAALAWGISDFSGGVQSRKSSVLSVAAWSRIAGALAIIVYAASRGSAIGPVSAILWGALSGLFGALGLLLFYRGLVAGLMSVVAPISACAAIIPVVVSVARGTHLGALQALAIAGAVCGIILISLSRTRSPLPRGHLSRSVLYAIGSACGFGLLYVFIDVGTSSPGGHVVAVVVASRITSGLTLATAAGWSGRLWPPPRQLTAVALLGLLDTAANGLFAYGTTVGTLAVVAVLASLYPVVTVLLARLVLGERLAPAQNAGAALAIAAAAVLAGTR